MKTAIALTSAALVLALALSLPALADDRQSITITMTGASDIGISLDVAHWPLGEVAPNTDYYTVPPIEWCTLTVTGSSPVNTLIEGSDATWVDDPGAYKWTLSDDGSNGPNVYGLWFRISGDTTRGPYEDGYVPITRTLSEFWPYDGGGDTLQTGQTRKFGLLLRTPTEFVGGRTMETQITIVAVAP